MTVQFASLNSGSNGNCYYIGNEQDAVLIDAGISCRETEKRLQRLHLSIDKVRAIFISHEHSDHIRGLAVLARKYRLPVFITPATLQNCRLEAAYFSTASLVAYKPIIIGELQITAFPKSHDAADPHSFLITCQELKVGVFTDIGFPCEHVTHHFKQCHAAFLETNYDDDLLNKGNYPYYLKNRIRGQKGHLSNQQALNLFASHKPSYMSYLLLAHLSKNNNCPELVEQLFSQHAAYTKIIVASRYEETPVYTLTPRLVPAETASPELFV